MDVEATTWLALCRTLGSWTRKRERKRYRQTDSKGKEQWKIKEQTDTNDTTKVEKQEDRQGPRTGFGETLLESSLTSGWENSRWGDLDPLL